MANCGMNDEQEVSRDKQRPPIYNPEDYATSLKKWGKKTSGGLPGLYHGLGDSAVQDQQKSRTLPIQNSKDFRNPCLNTSSAGEEMTLRQFSTPSELLTKLRADLRLAFPSFVQEFTCEPLDGVTLLLELLRNVQLSQSGETGVTGPGAPRVAPALQRRALLDELACLQCLSCCCARFPECARRLVAGSCGLYTLTVCIMSTVNKSRIIALQLLTKACNRPANGHSTISEALSTLRLRYGEPVRFRFLVGMLQSSGGSGELQAAGLGFINALLASAPSPQRKLYIQAELEQAGFDIVTFKKLISKLPSINENVTKEIESYEKQLIDVDSLNEKANEAQKEKDDLKNKLDLLEKRVKILQEEKGILISLEKCLKEKCCELQEEVSSLRSEHGNSNRKIFCGKNKSHRDESSPPEDEGISSSERSLSPEGDLQRESMVYEVFNVKNETFDMVRKKRPIHKKMDKTHEYHKTSDEEDETTIDEVIQELRNIVNDAESEQYAKEKNALCDDKSSRYNQTSEINVSIRAMESQRHRDLEKSDSVTSTRHSIHIMGSTDRLDEKVEEEESEIVPTKIVPHPPRKTKSLIHLFLPPTEQGLMYNKQPDYYDDNYYSSDEGSDSLLSGSKFPHHIPKKQSNASFDFQECRAMFNNMIETKERNVDKDQKRRSRTRSGEEVCTKVSLKRSESFQTSEVGSNKDHLKHRRDQIDSLFYIENQCNYNGGVKNNPLRRSESRCSQKGEDRTPSLAETKKLTKSLDRIDEGLNSMVDIVMMSEAKKTDWPYESRRKSTASRKSSDTKDTYSQTSKSNSKQHSFGHQRLDSRGSAGRNRDDVIFAKIDPNQKFFIPHPKLSTGSFDNHSISSYNNTSFLVKRGHANAGFYSGQSFLRDAPASMTSLVITGNHGHGDFNKALSPISPKSISNHMAPKVTDMPSGLY